MKTLYIDCSMGAAGDMLTAALFELLPLKDREAFLAKLNSRGIPGVVYAAEPSVKCGITGTHMTVTVNGEEEGCGYGVGEVARGGGEVMVPDPVTGWICDRALNASFTRASMHIIKKGA